MKRTEVIALITDIHVWILVTALNRSLGQGNIFTSLRQSFCSQGEGISVRCHFLFGCLASCSFWVGVSCYGPMFLPGSLGGLCLGGLCLGSLSRGVFVQRSLSRWDHCPWDLCSWGFYPGGLCLEVSVQETSPRQRPPVQWRVGGTHPTGTHSCLLHKIVFFIFHILY